MKKFSLQLIFILIAIAAYSQPFARLSFNLTPSVNWMKTSNSTVDNGKVIAGYDFGLSTDLYSSNNERYAFSTGLQIANIGGELAYHSGSDFKFAGKTLAKSVKIEYRLRYIEVPLTVKLKTDQFGRINYWGLLGLSGMINIYSRGTSNDGVLNKDKIGDEVNLFNLAMNLGAGLDYELKGNTGISVGLFFQNGLSDVTTDNVFKDKSIVNSLKLKIGVIF